MVPPLTIIIKHYSDSVLFFQRLRDTIKYMPDALNELLPDFPLLQEAFTPDELGKFLKKSRGRVDKVLGRLQATTQSCQNI